jgi:hypothetical protein
MAAAYFSETLVPIYQPAWHHISEDHNLNIHCSESLSQNETGFLEDFIPFCTALFSK